MRTVALQNTIHRPNRTGNDRDASETRIDAVVGQVKTAVERAMARDGSSGGIIRLVVITPEGVEREYVTVS